MKKLYIFIVLAFITTYLKAEDISVSISIDDTDATVSVTNVFDATKFEPKLNYVSENSEGVRISSNIYIVGYSSAAEYYGCGQYLTGLTAENANTLDFHDSIYFAVKADVAGSTATLKGLVDTNTAGVANLETSTAALALRAYNLERATQTLRTDINSNDTELDALRVSTGTHAVELEALRVSTGALLAIQNTIRVDTGTLRTDVDGKEDELAFISEDADGVQISSSVFSTGISSFTTYYGDGSNLTGIGAAGGWIGTATSDLDMDEFGMVDLATVTVTNPLVLTGNYIHVGDGGSVNYAGADGTLYMKSHIEADGNIYCSGFYNSPKWNGALTPNSDTSSISFGIGSDVYIYWSPAGNDHLTMGINVGAADESGVLAIKARDQVTTNYAHAVSANPYLIGYSSVAASEATDQYWGIRHNQTNVELNAGIGYIVCNTTITAKGFISTTKGILKKDNILNDLKAMRGKTDNNGFNKPDYTTFPEGMSQSFKNKKYWYKINGELHPQDNFAVIATTSTKYDVKKDTITVVETITLKNKDTEEIIEAWENITTDEVIQGRDMEGSIEYNRKAILELLGRLEALEQQ